MIEFNYNKHENRFYEKLTKDSHKIAILSKLICGFMTIFLFYSLLSSCNSFNDNEKIVKITPKFCKAIKKYDILSEFSEDLAAVRDKSSHKWGYINTRGREVISCKYEEATPFSEGLAAVSNENSKYGYINKKGNVVIDHMYDHAEPFSESIAVVIINADWNYPKLTFIDCKGKILDKLSNMNLRGSKFENSESGITDFDIDSFSNGIANYRVGVGDIDNYDGWICVDTQGNIVEKSDEERSVNSLYEITKEGIVNKDGVLIAKCPEDEGWEFPGSLYLYDGEKLHRFANINNGVILAKLEFFPDLYGDYDSVPIEIYGYLNLQGNSTFIDQDKDRIAQLYAEVELRKLEEEEKRKEEEERRKREGTEIVITLHGERTERDVTTYSGNHGASLLDPRHLRTKLLTVPSGKIWIFKKYELTGNSFLPEIEEGWVSNSRLISTGYKSLENINMFKIIGGRSFFLHLYLSRELDIPVDLKVYFIEKDEDYY